MDLDLNKFERYDFANAKVGDKVIFASTSIYSKVWHFCLRAVKSVSAKRGDVTLINGSRYDKTGRELGKSCLYDTSRTVILACTKENISLIDSYREFRDLATDVVVRLEEINREKIFDLSEDKLKKLNEVLTEVFGDSAQKE